MGSGWKHSHVPQATDEAGVRVKTQPCTSVLDRQEQGQDGNGHVLQTTDERWGHGGNTVMYSRRQARSGVRMGIQPSSPALERRELEQDGNRRVRQTRDESWGQHINTATYFKRQTKAGVKMETAMYFRRQTRGGVRMETQPCTSDDRREVGSGWKHSHVLQTTDERWGQDRNSHVLQTTDESWGQDGNSAIYVRQQRRAGVRVETQP